MEIEYFAPELSFWSEKRLRNLADVRRMMRKSCTCGGGFYVKVIFEKSHSGSHESTLCRDFVESRWEESRGSLWI